MVHNKRAGFFDGVDYRGQSVVAYLSRVPDTNWFLVSKIDEDEIYAPVRQLALWTSGIALLLLGASLAMVWGYVRRLRLAAHNRQLRIEKTVLSRRFEDLSRFAYDIFLLFDEHGRIVEVNEQAVTVYGYAREELLRMHGAELRVAEDAPQFDAALSDILAHARVSAAGMHRRKDGSVFPVDISARVLHLEHGRFIQNIVRDISQRKVAEQRLHHLAYYDDLTDLPNRTLLLDHLTQAMRAADRHHHLGPVHTHFSSANEVKTAPI